MPLAATLLGFRPDLLNRLVADAAPQAFLNRFLQCPELRTPFLFAPAFVGPTPSWPPPSERECEGLGHEAHEGGGVGPQFLQPVRKLLARDRLPVQHRGYGEVLALEVLEQGMVGGIAARRALEGVCRTGRSPRPAPPAAPSASRAGRRRWRRAPAAPGRWRASTARMPRSTPPAPGAGSSRERARCWRARDGSELRRRSCTVTCPWRNVRRDRCGTANRPPAAGRPRSGRSSAADAHRSRR